MSETNIRWIEITWNVILACMKCSEGCVNCYALKEAMRNVKRFRATAKSERARRTLEAYEGVLKWENGEPVDWNGEARFMPHMLDKPLQRKKPSTYFVGSMSDIFHESVPYQWLEQLFEYMVLAPWHRYTVLTKRPQNMVDKLSGTRVGQILEQAEKATETDSVPGIYLGITAENQQRLDERKPWLTVLPATGHFISAEPLLGPIDFDKPGRLDGVDQVLTGGESGKNHRPLDWDWIRNIRDACKRNCVEFFLQQNSAPRPEKMPELDGQQHTDLVWKK